MFRIIDRAITPRKVHYQRALERLPEAHRHAQAIGISHLHNEASRAATEAGVDPAPLGIGWHRNHAYLGIERSPAGDTLFDSEFGTATQAPNPVLRTSISAAHSTASALYGHALRERLGI